MTSFEDSFDVAIAGGGPAGTSAAIRLSQAGARVLLVEAKKFPREKLCGEFISPECVSHFKSLGVAVEMYAAGATPISKTVFYTRRGYAVSVSNEWFESETPALGLSRSEMDHKLLQRAVEAGVKVIENAHASALIDEDRRVVGLEVKVDDAIKKYSSLVTIDATGRTRALARQVEPVRDSRTKRRTLVAFKAHLEGAEMAKGACEIYFYPKGYGGLSRIEKGLSNLCFIVSAEDVRRCSSDPEAVMRSVVMKNSRAAATLKNAVVRTPWLSVSLDGFGPRTAAPAPGLLNIGDAASFIDPFTGSGMLMALESGQLVADGIRHNLEKLRRDISGLDELATEYRVEYTNRFDSRLRVAGRLRRAAFLPWLAEATALLCGTSFHLRRKLAHLTRSSGRGEVSSSVGA